MDRLKRLAGWAVIGGLLAWGGTAEVLADPLPPAKDTGDQRGAMAQTVLRRATDFLEKLDRFQADATTVFDTVQGSGQTLQFSTRRVITVRRPDRAFGSYTDDHGDVQHFWYDGELLTRYDRSRQVYGQLSVPGSLDDMLDFMELEMRAPLPLADLLYSDLSGLGERAVQSTHVGASHVSGVLCDHLAFRNELLDWEIWVERGKQPWIRKLVIRDKRTVQRPQLVVYLTRWDEAPKVPDRLFEFAPSPGARRIPTIAFPARGESEEVLVKGAFQ